MQFDILGSVANFYGQTVAVQWHREGDLITNHGHVGSLEDSGLVDKFAVDEHVDHDVRLTRQTRDVHQVHRHLIIDVHATQVMILLHSLAHSRGFILLERIQLLLDNF